MPDGMWTEEQFRSFIANATIAAEVVCESSEAISEPTKRKIQDVRDYILSDGKLPKILAVFNAAQTKG